MAAARTNCVSSEVDDEAATGDDDRPTCGEPGTSEGVLTVSSVLQ